MNSVDETQKTEETLSAIIRVLAQGELEEEANSFYKNLSAINNHRRLV